MEIGDWIAHDDPERAATFVDEIENACRELLDRPRAYPPVAMRSGRILRKRTFGKYLILFEENGDGVRVATVVHGARDIASLAL